MPSVRACVYVDCRTAGWAGKYLSFLASLQGRMGMGGIGNHWEEEEEKEKLY